MLRVNGAYVRQYGLHAFQRLSHPFELAEELLVYLTVLYTIFFFLLLSYPLYCCFGGLFLLQAWRSASHYSTVFKHVHAKTFIFLLSFSLFCCNHSAVMVGLDFHSVRLLLASADSVKGSVHVVTRCHALFSMQTCSVIHYAWPLYSG